MKNLNTQEIEAVGGAGRMGRLLGGALGRALLKSDYGEALGGEIGSRIEDALKSE